jgi:diadenylate cyclase
MFDRIRELVLGIGFNLPSINIPAIGLSELVDILIVSYIVYFVMKWIRHTRAWSLIKGIMIIIIIWAAAWIFNLITVLWILENALTMGLIVVVILFQPELRNALEQIGRGKIFSSLSAKNDDKSRFSIHTVNEVTKAVIKMASVKTGAIIVMEREVALGEHENTGIALDAAVSSQLLLNIFEDKTPR